MIPLLIALIALAVGYLLGTYRTKATLAAELEKARQASVEALARLDAERRHTAETMQRQNESLRSEFRAIAAELARTEGEQLRREHLDRLHDLLAPLGKDIAGFREQFLKGNADMGRYIRDLIDQTEAVGRDAEGLTRALKANTKMQGNWGETILGNLLAASGLTEGRDYEVQTVAQDADGHRLIPDVVVKLPQERAVIIDSKVSLTAFTTYANATDAVEQAAALKEHLRSVRRHVSELGEKHYGKVVKNAIGYVLMFIPNEAAYIAAVTNDDTLAADAYRRQVILVNPTNLLMALQLAYNLWQSEMQSRSVREIYASAEKLYKKFSTFATNFVKIGRGIRSLDDLYREAEGQLKTGRGNIVSQLEGWKRKGLSPSGEMPAELREPSPDEAD